MKMKVLLSSIMTIALCLSLIAGSTFALFTSTDKVNVAVNSGKVNVDAWYVENSLSHTSTLGTTLPETKVTTDGTTLTIDKMVPGDVVSVQLHVENGSNVTAKYRTILECIEDTGLLEGLVITLQYGNNGQPQNFYGFACSNWTEIAGNKAIEDVTLTIALPVDRGNEYQSKTAKFAYTVEAIQGNADVADFDGVNVRNINDYRLLASRVAAGESYADQTVYLCADLDFQGKPLIPVGTASSPFLGTFEGQNHTIKNFSIVKHEGAGLFGFAGIAVKNLKKSAYIRNVNADNFTIISNHYAGGIVGKLWGEVTGCNVTNAQILVSPSGENGNYDNGDKVGGIVGWLNNGKADGNTVKNSTIIAYRDLGGIAGFANEEGGSTSVSNNLVENVTLDYDMSGKLYSDPQAYLGAIVGRCQKTSITTENNTVISTYAPIMATPENIQDSINNAVAGDTIYLSKGDYTDMIIAKSNTTILGLPGAMVGCINLNGSSNVTLKNITFDAAGSQIAYSKGTAQAYANIISAQKDGKVGARNIVIDGCTFTGEFGADKSNANFRAAIAFTDRNRTSGGSGNVTITNCTFEAKNTTYNVYSYYTGYAGANFVIDGNTFNSECAQLPIYLGRLSTNEAVVVKNNAFKTEATFENAVIVQAASTSWTTTAVDAGGNTYGN